MAVTKAYHAARKHMEIIDILHPESGEKHDPQLMRLFFEFIETGALKTGAI